MKKITFKNAVLLLICFVAFQMQAQIFNGAGSYRIRAFNKPASGTYAGQNVYPTVTSVPSSPVPATENGSTLPLRPKNIADNSQVLTFIANGEIKTINSVDYTVYNIKCEVPGAGILEIRDLTATSGRAAIRGNTAPVSSAVNPLATWIVKPDLVNLDGSYRIVIATYADDAVNFRQLLATNADDFLNYGGYSVANKDRWFFETATLGTNDFDTSSIFVSNPVNNELSIKGLTSQVKEVSIYSLLGKLVLQTKVNSKSSLKLDVSMLSSGIYILKMTSDSGSFSKKIIKE